MEGGVVGGELSRQGNWPVQSSTKEETESSV